MAAWRPGYRYTYNVNKRAQARISCQRLTSSRRLTNGLSELAYIINEINIPRGAKRTASEVAGYWNSNWCRGVDYDNIISYDSKKRIEVGKSNPANPAATRITALSWSLIIRQAFPLATHSLGTLEMDTFWQLRNSEEWAHTWKALLVLDHFPLPLLPVTITLVHVSQPGALVSWGRASAQLFQVTDHTTHPQSLVWMQVIRSLCAAVNYRKKAGTTPIFQSFLSTFVSHVAGTPTVALLYNQDPSWVANSQLIIISFFTWFDVSCVSL